MSILENHGLKRVINAWGTPTLYGVSKAEPEVIDAVGQALGEMVHMPALMDLAGKRLAAFSGAPWGCVTHCTASAITLACAAVMTRSESSRIAQLPNTEGMKNQVLIGAGHRVSYGAPISQAIALSGAREVVVGAPAHCSMEALQEALSQPEVAGLVYVVSHLTKPGMPALERVIEAAAAFGVPVIVDAAAQDLRLKEWVGKGADLTLFSAQKYLKAPTAGLVFGRRDLVTALDAQHSGIGRGMKPTKEAVFGVLAALELRSQQDSKRWMELRESRIQDLAQSLSLIPALDVEIVPDPMGNPFQRIRISPNGRSPLNARQLADALAESDPIIATGAHYAEQGFLNLEAHDLDGEECSDLVAAVSRLLV